MKILVICHYGLYENLSFSFVHNQIREFINLGHRVRVIIPNGWGKTGRDGKRLGKTLHVSLVDGVELYDLRYLTLSGYGEKGFNTKRAIGAIRAQRKKIFGDFRPDVIHAHTLGFDSEIGAWLKSKFGVPLVVTTHGSDTVVPLQRGQGERLRVACKKADVVIAVSSALAEKLRLCGTNTPIKTIVNGFVHRSLPSDIVRYPQRIIQVCHLIPSKRVDVTIRAFALLQKQNPAMELCIIGQGAQKDDLVDLCESAGVSDKVTFLGQVSNDVVFRELCQSTFFVMVSRPEGFGIVYLEAMAAGCITVGTEGEGITDVIRSGENGFLLPADDPKAIADVIEWCLKNSEDAKSIAEYGRKAALELTWEKNANEYIVLFEELLKQ